MRVDEKVLNSKPLSLLYIDDPTRKYAEAMVFFARKGKK